jgi:ATP-dependent phosphoenolpyruvate carboxykinase
MATSLLPHHPPFHTLLENPATNPKNSSIETLLAIAERRGEGTIASNGALVALTGEYTGRRIKGTC